MITFILAAVAISSGLGAFMGYAGIKVVEDPVEPTPRVCSLFKNQCSYNCSLTSNVYVKN